ncbi:MAG: sulfotransferase [Phycisphaerales bacterium]|nr:sulfotransferase [Phycisphaerales bacterium]
MPSPIQLIRQAKRARKDARNARWRGGDYISQAGPIIIGGCPRSGTTLIRVILDTHPSIAAGPETAVFRTGLRNPKRLASLLDLPEADVASMQKRGESQARFIDELFAAYCDAAGKARWAEKTPENIQHVNFIFKHFPNARFIHAIRDGRDTICSLRTHPRHKVVDGKIVPIETNNPIDQCIDTWIAQVSLGLPLRDDPRCFELRYEDLVLDSEPVLRRLFDFLDEPWDPRVLAFHEVKGGSRDAAKFPQNPEATQRMSAKSIGRWREQLSRDDLDLFYERAGALMQTFGYDITADAQARS